ncbi:hydroxyacylglutathione hydrolase [Pseudoalteromonas sp. GB56]
MAQVEPIKAYSDNYIWALCCKDDNRVVVVDPGQAEPVLAYLKENNKTLDGILITHHHWDHTTGVAQLKQQFPDITVYGPQNSPFEGIDSALNEGDSIKVIGYDFAVLETPGHTLDHICYIGEGFIFCGDTLFSGGCGRLFEGTPAQMWHSLQKLSALDESTLVYCTHEYTQANMRFASACQQNNDDVQAYSKKVDDLRDQGLITLPSTIGLENRINPFLRPEEISIQSFPAHQRPSSEDPESKFAALRKWKDDF